MSTAGDPDSICGQGTKILEAMWPKKSFLIATIEFYLKITCCDMLSRSDSLQSYGLQPARHFCPWGFSRQEYWSGLPCSSPGDRLNLGIEPRSPALKVDSLPSEPPGKLTGRKLE